MRLHGWRRHGTATVVEDDDAVAEYVHEFIDRHGTDGLRRLALEIEGDEVPSRDALAPGLGETVVVRIDLDGE